MGLQEKLDQTIEVMRRTKEAWVASKPDNNDLLIYSHFWRNDEVVAVVVSPLVRDIGLQAAMIGCSGFNADVAAMTFEGYHSNLGESPLTHQPWMHQEMQFIAETMPDQEWVSEVVNTHILDRDGHMLMSSIPFKIVDHAVCWEESIDLSSMDGEMSGFMVDHLRHAMKSPTAEQVMLADDRDIAKALFDSIPDVEQRNFHYDMATCRALMEKNLVASIMLSSAGIERRAEWLQDRMGPASHGFYKMGEDVHATVAYPEPEDG